MGSLSFIHCPVGKQDIYTLCGAVPFGKSESEEVGSEVIINNSSLGTEAGEG